MNDADAKAHLPRIECLIVHEPVSKNDEMTDGMADLVGTFTLLRRVRNHRQQR